MSNDFAITPRDERDPLAPDFDPRESPLSPGGRRDPFGRVPGAAEHFRGLLDFPSMPHPRRAIYKVRREGWVARREAARTRYRDIHEQGDTSQARILGKLVTRRGILDRARANAIHPRFNLRMTP